MLCRMLCCSLVAVSVLATSLPADDPVSAAGDDLSEAVQEYLELSAAGKLEEADALLEELAEEHPDAPAVQLMRAHAELRQADAGSVELAYPESWDELSARRQKRLAESEAARRHLQDALEQRIDVDFDDATLESAMQHFAGTCGINVVVDEIGLQEVGATPYTKLNLRVTNVRLATVLELILEPLNLGYEVQDEVLKISSEMRLAGPLTTMVYAVPDLIRTGQHLVGGEVSEAESYDEGLERLSQTIQQTIDPNGWSQFGGQGYIQPHEGTLSLVVRQTPAVHREITDLLASLRTEQALTVAHDVSMFDVTFNEAQRLGLESDSDPVLKTAGELDEWWTAARISTQSRERVARAKCRLHSGQTGGVDVGDVDDEVSFLLNSRVADDRRTILVKMSAPRSNQTGDVMAAVQTARIPDGGAAVFVLPSDANIRGDRRLRICIVQPSIDIAEEEEELFGIPSP